MALIRVSPGENGMVKISEKDLDDLFARIEVQERSLGLIVKSRSAAQSSKIAGVALSGSVYDPSEEDDDDEKPEAESKEASSDKNDKKKPKAAAAASK